MATAVPIFEVSYTAPGSPPVWIDETPYLRRFDTSRGRATELDRTETGTATFVLSNSSRRFDPTYVSGAHYPNVRVWNRCRLKVQIATDETAFAVRSSGVRGGAVFRGGTRTYGVFYGFVESWGQGWDRRSRDSTVTVKAVDGFARLALDDFVWGFRYNGAGDTPDDYVCGKGSGNVVPDNGPPYVPDDLSGTRIARILDCFGAWTDATAIDAGSWTILGSAAIFAGTKNVHVETRALTHLLDVAAAEGGEVFVDRDGRLVFHSQNHEYLVDDTVVWGDAGGEQPYRDVAAPTDDARLYNAVIASAVDTTIQGSYTKENAASQTRYDRRPFAVTMLNAASPDGSVNAHDRRSDDLLANYQEPRLRFPSLDLVPTTAAELVAAFGRDLFDRVPVRRRPTEGPTIERLERIEGINVSGDARNPRDIRISWNLSHVLLNLLTPNQEGFEGGTTGWAAETNATIATSTAQKYRGSSSGQLTATALGDASMVTPTGTSGIAVTPGRYYSARTFARSAVTSRTVRIYLRWYTSAGTLISSSSGSATDVSTGWNPLEVQAQAPATAAYVAVALEVVAAAASEVHRFDYVRLYPDLV